MIFGSCIVNGFLMGSEGPLAWVCRIWTLVWGCMVNDLVMGNEGLRSFVWDM